jgi:protein tyrosine/serine phosphatase
MAGRSGRAVANRIVAGLLLIVAAILGHIVWHNIIKDQFVPKRFAEVIPGHLYRSGQISGRLIEAVLRQYDIEIVIDLNAHEEKWLVDQLAEEQAARNLEIEHLRLPLRGDGTGDIGVYARAIEEIARAQREDKTILVHCAAGTRRTGGVVAAYLMLVEGASTDVVMSELGRHGSRLSESKLLAYLNESSGALARILVEDGLIDAVPEVLPRLGP